MVKEKLVKVLGCVRVRVVKSVAVGVAGRPPGQSDMLRRLATATTTNLETKAPLRSKEPPGAQRKNLIFEMDEISFVTSAASSLLPRQSNRTLAPLRLSYRVEQFGKTTKKPNKSLKTDHFSLARADTSCA